MSATGAFAQASAPRRVVFADIGYARTYDDEGLLGSGAALRGGAGLRVTPRLTIQAVVDRIPYYRDIEYLRFDGRVLFGGVELAFQSSRPHVRPFITIGVGAFDDDRMSIAKTIVDPLLPRVETSRESHYSFGMFTSSGGVDIRVSDRASIRAGVRLHGLLNTGNDAVPHSIIQPTIGAAYRW